ncbi:MAG TPA: cell wall metabolism sensor histidine kinase WalK [Syntrophomonadaceae bacterium]|nr:cell wall metabolism sensor histidine kinase WalK [Syntrophomonadaceae bacterium]
MGRSLFHKLLASYLIIILVTLSVVGLMFSELFTNYYFKAKEQELITKGQEVSRILAGYINEGIPFPTIDLALMALDRSLNARAFVIDNSGQIVATTAGRFAPRGMFLDPGEASQVLQGKVVSWRGFNPRFNQVMVSAAVPIQVDNQTIGALILNTSVVDITPAIAVVRRFIIYAAVATVILAMVIGYYLSKSISHPLRRMSQATKAMSQGNFAQRIEVTSQDEIGQLAQNFNELAQALDDTISALKLEKDKVENVLKNMAEGVLAVDHQGRIIMANAQAARTLGFKDQEFKGRLLAELTSFSEIDELFADVLREKQALTAEFKLPNNKFILAHVSLLQENGETFGAVAVLQDITGLRRLEELRRDFVANVSHELRTPLTSIQAFVEALLDGLVEDPATQSKYLKVIHDETLRLKRLIHDLLDLSLIESGKAKWQVMPVNLKEITSRVLEKLMPQIEEKALEIKTEIPEELPPALGNIDRIEQVLINLVHNAIQFTPKGGRIEISGSACGDEIRVSVADTGEGIPEEDLPYIWDRFHKVDKSRTRGSGGTGLGLAIVKHIVDAHGGRVEVESEQGKGSTFTFYLPQVK